MNTAADSQQNGNRFAVIRHYEPTRIERELLAQVFEIVSHRPEHDDRHVDRESAATISCGSEAVVDAKPRRALAHGRCSSRVIGASSMTK